MKLPVVAAAAVLLGLTTALEITPRMRNAFDGFRAQFNKTYSSRSETEARMEIFAESLRTIQEHNSQPGVPYKMEINHFSDFTEQEFKSYVSGYTNTAKPDAVSPRFRSRKRTAKLVEGLPKSVDWRKKGVITKVKDQGSCGSCWAFATTEQIESYLKLSGDLEEDELKVLSAQQIASCAPNPLRCGGTGGCYGATAQIGFSYVHNFGLVDESEYSYTSGYTGSTGKCLFNVKTMKRAAYLRGFETLVRNDVAEVMKHLAEVGPLGIAVAANSWRMYGGGVFDGCSYHSNIEINHAVQLVGYGTDEKQGDYWIVRNTWGEHWGEGGYIRLRRESTEVCGTDSTPATGSACPGDGVTISKVCGMCGMLFDSSYPIGVGSTNTAIP